LQFCGACKSKGHNVFAAPGAKPFQHFAAAKRKLDEISGVSGWRLHDLRRTCVSGMARLGIAPHVADKVLNHQSGTISGVAAVYQRHEFLLERRVALEQWGTHVGKVVMKALKERRTADRAA
jgi:integrase